MTPRNLGHEKALDVRSILLVNAISQWFDNTVVGFKIMLLFHSLVPQLTGGSKHRVRYKTSDFLICRYFRNRATKVRKVQCLFIYLVCNMGMYCLFIYLVCDNTNGRMLLVHDVTPISSINRHLKHLQFDRLFQTNNKLIVKPKRQRNKRK